MRRDSRKWKFRGWATATIGAAALAVGCSHDPIHAGSAPDVKPGTQNHLVFAGGGESFDVEVTATSLIGARMNVARSADGFRGEAFGQAVNVSVDEKSSNVRGVVGMRPLQFSAVPEGQGRQHLQGLVAGRVSDFHLGPEGADGMLGPCSYQLRFTGGAYEGTRSCGGGGLQMMELRIPRTMDTWSPADRMTALALFLLAR